LTEVAMMDKDPDDLSQEIGDRSLVSKISRRR